MPESQLCPGRIPGRKGYDATCDVIQAKSVSLEKLFSMVFPITSSLRKGPLILFMCGKMLFRCPTAKISNSLIHLFFACVIFIKLLMIKIRPLIIKILHEDYNQNKIKSKFLQSSLELCFFCYANTRTMLTISSFLVILLSFNLL